MQPEAFERRLERSSEWRKKEITEIKLAASDLSPTLLRAAYVLVFSHWDGYFADAVAAIIDYLNGIYGSWTSPPKRFVLSRAKRLCEIDTIGALLSFVKNETAAGPHHRLAADSIVGAGRDLRPEAVTALLFCLDVPVSTELENKIGTIYRTLAHTRHAIAHGEKRELSPKDLTQACELVAEAVDLLSDCLRSTILERTL